MLSEKTLSVVIPCYNEALNIPLLLKRFDEVIQNQNIEIILVNNGSTDHSGQVLATLIPQYAFANTVEVLVNKGYGNGILEGLKKAQGEYLGWTHADLQTDPKDVVKAWHLIQNNPNAFVKGIRKGRSGFDNFFSIGMSLFQLVFLNIRLWEINAQPTLFHRSFWESWQNPPKDFALDLYTYYFAKKRKLKIIRFPVLFPDRQHGVSSWNTSLKQKLKFIIRTMNYSLKVRKVLK